MSDLTPAERGAMECARADEGYRDSPRGIWCAAREFYRAALTAREDTQREPERSGNEPKRFRAATPDELDFPSEKDRKRAWRNRGGVQ